MGGEWRTEHFLKVDERGRITIPSSAREKLGIIPGKTVMKAITTSDSDGVITLRRWE